MATRTTVIHTHPVQQVQKESSIDRDAVIAREHREHNVNVAERTVWFLGDFLMLLLAFRFFLALFGANPANGFANFIYTISRPFVAPFFGLFNYAYRYGISQFEAYTLIAILVYGVITWMITRLVTLDRW
jgi:uncharacterized protein YggT (Ycf19 family)